MGSKKQKIYLENAHVAYVNSELLFQFRHTYKVSNFSAWLKQQADECFGIKIISTADLSLLTEAVQMNYYDNIGEWLQDRMRQAILHGWFIAPGKDSNEE